MRPVATHVACITRSLYLSVCAGLIGEICTDRDGIWVADSYETKEPPGGTMVGRRTCDQEVASSIHGRARLRNESGQVVHTQLPRRWHSLLVYRVVKLGTFTFLPSRVSARSVPENVRKNSKQHKESCFLDFEKT